MEEQLARALAQRDRELHAGGEAGEPDGEFFWTIDDAFEGTQIFGETGSGKTSGSGAANSGR